MPPGFGFPEGRAAWMPLPYGESFSSETATNRRAEYLTVLARLRPGITVEQAATEVRTIASRLEQRFAETNTNVGAAVVPLHEMIVGEVRTPLLILLGAVGLVLLIACANVANLLLARATTREGELAIRAALGAGRGRLIRQMLTESLLLGLLGGTVGLLLAWYGTDVLVALRPEDIPRLENVGIDAAAVLFTAAAALLTGLIFGLIPAFQITRANLTGSLKEGGRALAGRGRSRVRQGLVVGEMALAVMLLVGAGLLLRSFIRLQQVDPGFRAEGALAFDLSLPTSNYSEPTQVADFYRRLLERLQTLPGVQVAGATTVLPLGGNRLILDFNVEGQEPSLPGQGRSMLVRAATPDYFRTVGVPTRRGRVFSEADRAGAPGVVVLNEAAVQRFFPNEDPIGKHIETGWGFDDGTFASGEVVGIVGNVKQNGLGEDAAPELYLPHAQFAIEEMSVVLRTTRQDPLALVSSIREEVRALDPNLPPTEFRTLEQVVSRSVAQPRFYTLLLSVFAGVALTLAAIGIFGVISYAVVQRTREIGIRMALGASTGSVLRLVVGGVVGLAAGGAVLGVIGSLALGRFLGSLLYGVTATDLTTYVAVVVILFAIALLASYIPARRAARVDPMVALRAE
jgi:putative ABC transport system permease protein